MKSVMKMWKIILEAGAWLADGAVTPTTTPNEDEAATFPDMPAAQQALTNARRSLPYRDAIIYAAFKVND